MARFLVSTLCFCALALAAASRAAAQDERAKGEELVFQSESLTLDRQSNLIQARGPRITQGDLRIMADEALATGIEFDKASEWRFTGNVRLEVGTTVIEADKSVFTFENEQLSRGELEGGPVSFTAVDEATQRSVTGQAQKMSYDYIGRTMRMTGSPAWVQKDNIEMQGCDVIYDLADGRMSSGSTDCADLFRLRVLPDTEERAAAPDPPQ
jgi:lipopolysaccharide transport protein LptA